MDGFRAGLFGQTFPKDKNYSCLHGATFSRLLFIQNAFPSSQNSEPRDTQDERLIMGPRNALKCI